MPLKDPDKRREYQKLYARKWYKANRQKQIDASNRRRRKLLEWFRSLKRELSCIKCGENHPACLDFHHRDPSQKDREIAMLLENGVGRKKIVDEIAKCDVLCANCHRKLHWDEMHQ